MEYYIFLILAPFSLGILIVTGVVIGMRYHNPLPRTLLCFFICVICYLSANIVELLLPSPEQTNKTAMIGHIFFSFLPVIWLRFSILYVGNRRLKEIWKIFPFCIIPVITIILMFTTNKHHLFWKSIDYIQIDRMLTMDADYGPWMWIYGFYNDTIYIIGVILILQAVIGSKKLYKKQSGIIITAIMIPLIFNALYAFRMLPFLQKDFTSISYSLTALMCFIGISKLQLLRIVPVIRNNIIQDMRMAYIVFDKMYNIIDFNNTAESFFNLNDHHLGRPLSTITSLENFLNPLLYNNNEYGEQQIEKSNQYYNVIKMDLSKKSSHYEGFLYTIIDVTAEITLINEKTAMAETLKRINSELKSAQSIIIQQEKMATIGQLTAGIAHEINNPLSFVKNNFHIYEHYWKLYNNMILSNKGNGIIEISKKTKELKDQMETIFQDSQDGTNRVVKIVQDLLKFSRPAENCENLLCDLNKSVETCLAIMGNQLKYTACFKKKTEEIPKIECRETEINQVLINLLTNAAHAVKTRKENCKENYEPCITLNTWTDKKSVFCSITDNGISIRKKDIPFIFEPFFTTKKSGEGTGLGLSIVKDIIEGRYNGKIDVVVDNQTSFILSIPIKQKIIKDRMYLEEPMINV